MPVKNNVWEVAIVGAGPAGLMTAITCARANLRVLLLDGREKIGAKILMSGGTRCNLTNERVSENDFQSETKRSVRHVLNAFPSGDTIQFFETIGVQAVKEDGGKFFPSTHSGKTVLDALVKEMKKCGVRLETSRRITQIKFVKNQFQISTGKETYLSKTVALCTGGLSYPETGSDGVGYEIAKSLGHHLISTSPSLTPLLTDDQDLKKLSGITLPVELTLWVNQKKTVSCEGSFLLTHFGFSGPVVLDMSGHWIRHQARGEVVKLTANFLPDETENEFRGQLTRAGGEKQVRSVKNMLLSKLPERLVRVFLSRANISDSTPLYQLRREQRENLLQSLFCYALSISGALGYEKAEVTAGGVDLSEVDSKTLESKIYPGLFFAGEILDVDGRIGGFNFQWAFSSGVVAARGIVRRVQKLVSQT